MCPAGSTRRRSQTPHFCWLVVGVWGYPRTPQARRAPAQAVVALCAGEAYGEHYCRLFTQLYGLETITLRYFNVFGARQNPASQYAAVIPRFIMACLKDEPLQIFGDGHQSRDFTYVDNVVQGNILAMTTPAVAGQVMNLANGSRTTLLELVAHLEALTQRRARVEFLPERPGDVRHSQADVTRAKTLLNFAPQVDVPEGLQRTLAYYAQQLADAHQDGLHAWPATGTSPDRSLTGARV